MRTIEAVITGLAIIPSAGYADCYGLHEPNELEQRAAYVRDCETIRSLISCGVQQADAVAIVVDRRAMEGYMDQFIASCATARAKAPPARR